MKADKSIFDADRAAAISESLAVAHKDYDTRGGGEVLAERLASQLDAPLIVGRRNEDIEERYDRVEEIPLTNWQKQCIDRGGLTRSVAYWIAWQNADLLTEFDTVVTSGNEPLWYVPTDDQTLVAYTHSTPRWQYDLSHETGNGAVGAVLRTAMRTIYQHNVTRPDHWVANSDLVARRINRYWDIPQERIDVVYPPVDVEHYSRHAAESQEFYLYLGRLVGHKRVDLLLEAFREIPDKRLVIAGRGPEEERLRREAPPNVEFRGFVDEAEKRELYSSAKALAYPPKNEDFGMVPIEAMASGTPVLGVDDGFTCYQIETGGNGHLFEPEPDDVVRVVETFDGEGVAWSEARIEEFAQQFSTDHFVAGMREAIAKAKDQASIETDLKRPIPEVQ